VFIVSRQKGYICRWWLDHPDGNLTHTSFIAQLSFDV